MPLWSADLSPYYDRLGTECLGEFALLSLSRDDPISDTFKLWIPSGEIPTA